MEYAHEWFDDSKFQKLMKKIPLLDIAKIKSPNIIFALLSSFLLTSKATAQSTIFSENVGTGSGTLSYAANAWQNLSPILFSGTGDTRVTSASSGYTGASGGRNVFLTTSGNPTLGISGINTLNFSSYGVTFGALKSTIASNLSDLTIDFTTSGNSGSVGFAAQATGSGTAIWRLITASSSPLVGSANLSLLFKNTSATNQVRLDDIKITGTARTAATTLVWNRGASNGNWYDGNWTGNNAPTAGISGDALEFAGATGGATTNDVTGGLVVASLKFNSGAGAFTNSGNSLTLNGAVTNSSSNLQTISHAVVLSSGSHSVDAASGDIAIGGAISGSGSISKIGSNTLTLSTSNSYAGSTTVTGGTLALGASNVLPTTQVVLDGGTLLAGGFEDTVGSLSLTDNSKIDLGSSTGKFTFGNSSAAWSGTLTVWNWVAGGLNFGSSSGLSNTQLTTQINVFTGNGVTQFTSLSLDNTGTLVAVPEAGTIFAVLGLMAPLAYRERRHWMRCREARA